MAEIEFIYNGIKTVIQSEINKKFKDILKNLSAKIEIQLDSIYCLYSGKVIDDQNLSLYKIMNNIDKENKKMTVQINDIDKTSENNSLIKSKQAICPKCGEKAKMSINDYKIRLYDCINGHDTNDILLEEFENTQKIDLSKIICEKCKINNKANSYKNIFYKCNTCRKILCPICKEQDDLEHNIINYDDKNYICEKHSYPYTFYCKVCHNNICILCEKDHSGHEIVSYGKILPDENALKNKMKDFRNKIDLFNKDIIKIIDILNNLIENIELLYKINEDILKNNNYKNYEMINNLSAIKFDDYIEDLNKIINDNNMANKFKNIMSIYYKIKPINIIKTINTKKKTSNLIDKKNTEKKISNATKINKAEKEISNIIKTISTGEKISNLKGWGRYIRDCLINKKDYFGHIYNNVLVEAAIIGFNGAEWAKTEGITVSKDEVNTLNKLFNQNESNGIISIYLGGKKYQVIHKDNFSVYLKMKDNGATVAKTNQAFIIGIYNYYKKYKYDGKELPQCVGMCNMVVEDLASILRRMNY